MIILARLFIAVVHVVRERRYNPMFKEFIERICTDLYMLQGHPDFEKSFSFTQRNIIKAGYNLMVTFCIGKLSPYDKGV